MDFSKEELDIEVISAEASSIQLESNATKCEVCVVGSVVSVGRATTIVIYTRFGTKQGEHIEKRCNNRSLPCRAGHFYGYTKTSEGKIVDSDVLRNEYLGVASKAFKRFFLNSISFVLLTILLCFGF